MNGSAGRGRRRAFIDRALRVMAGGLLPFVVLPGLRSSSEDAPRPLRVLYLGASARATDPTFRSLVESLRRNQPDTLARIAWRYAAIPDAESAIEPAVAAALADPVDGASGVDLIVALNGLFAASARRHAGRTPIVFSSYEDPVAFGFVSTLRSRSEPICGVSLADELEGKRFEILRQAWPGTRELAVLADHAWADQTGVRRRVEEEATRQGLHATLLIAEDVDQVRALFADPDSRRFDAWYVPTTFLALSARPLIRQNLRAWRKPSIWSSTEEVRDGAQMAYSQETQFTWQALAELIARVLGGEPAGAIPIMRPDHFTLAVRVTPDVGAPPPDISIIRRADRVVR